MALTLRNLRDLDRLSCGRPSCVRAIGKSGLGHSFAGGSAVCRGRRHRWTYRTRSICICPADRHDWSPCSAKPALAWSV